MPEYLPVSWDRLHADARTLAAMLHREGPWRGIVAISRGGLVPAAIVARELDCRLVETVCVVTYQAEAVGAHGEPLLLKPPAAAGDGEGYVVIDDLVDSGTTARHVRTLLPRARLACLYAKPAGETTADMFVSRIPQGVWVLFPWDSAPTFVPPLAEAAPTASDAGAAGVAPPGGLG